MSSRHFRKFVGKPEVTSPVVEDSDEEYQPLYANHPWNSKYEGLIISSQSESECETEERSEEEAPQGCVAASQSSTPKKKNNKKKGKGKGHKQNEELVISSPSEFERETPERSEEEAPQGCVAASQSATPKKKNNKRKGKGKGNKQKEDMDEIDRYVQEVNNLLGAPAPAPTPQPQKVNEDLAVLAIDPKHLNVANEIRRMFGPEESEHTRRPRVQPNRALLLKRVLIHPNKETAVYDFHNSGLSMTKYKEVNNIMYFIFNHNADYQMMHRIYLDKFNSTRNKFVMYLEDVREKMHVEALLEISDRLFIMEENSAANEIVENVVTYLQYVAHPLFILSQNNVRLEYKFMENRIFHVAMLKYVYLLSNKACHRTALEIVKMMLLVDPSDPLALLSLVDIIALRAREHEWLIEAIKCFDRQRDAGMLFNIKYSNGLAHFHVANKKKLELENADIIIQEAILGHPQVFLKILECCNSAQPTLIRHAIFREDPKQNWSRGIEELFMIYAKMTASRWNEPGVMAWLIRNANALCNNYDMDTSVSDSARDWVKIRRSLFQVWPVEYLRHMSVFHSMSKLIIDAQLNSFKRPTCAWDPVFDESVNRYGYKYYAELPSTVPDGYSPVYRFFHSMLPSYFDS